jgi:DNA modification methylase
VDTGVIYCDDNRQRLAVLPRESIDLIYLDPPFFSNRHYVRISGESDHPFRLNPTTCFGGIRPGISVESDHLFR